MRVLTATMGALVSPMAFMTLKSSGQSVLTATMAALLVTLGNNDHYLFFMGPEKGLLREDVQLIPFFYLL